MFGAADEFRRLLGVESAGRGSHWAINIIIAAAVAIPLIAVFLIVRMIVASALDGLTETPAPSPRAPASVTVMLPPPAAPLLLAAVVSPPPAPSAPPAERRESRSRRSQLAGLSPRRPALSPAAAVTPVAGARPCPPGSALCIDGSAEKSVLSLFAPRLAGSDIRDPKKLEAADTQPVPPPEEPVVSRK